MTPFTFEDRVLPSYTIPDVPMACEPHGLSPDDCPTCVEFPPEWDERGGRECPLCQPYVLACTHFDGYVVKLIARAVSRLAHTPRCNELRGGPAAPGWVVMGGLEKEFFDCPGCGVRNTFIYIDTPGFFKKRYPTEAAARAEFERRCELMRQEAE